MLCYKFLGLFLLAFVSLGANIDSYNSIDITDLDQTDISFSDLPRLEWASGFEFVSSLRWGMTVNEVERAVGARLRYIGAQSGIKEFSCNLSTTWHRHRIKFPDQAFFFVKDKLFMFNIDAYDGWEENLLGELFSTFGPSRHTRRDRNESGSLVRNPIKRNTPDKLRGSDNSPPGYEYQWMDAETKISAIDGYGYVIGSRPGIKDRSVSVSFTGWKYAAQNWGSEWYKSSREWEEDARDFLMWYSRIKRIE